MNQTAVSLPSVHIDEVIVKTAGLRLGYGRRTVLAHVDFEIRAGEFWFFLGPNGEGKTTLLRAILGMVRPQAGQLWVHPELGDRGRLGFVTHNLAIAARYATHIALFHAGEVMSGPRQEVLNRQTLERIYGVAVEISSSQSGAPGVTVCPSEGSP